MYHAACKVEFQPFYRLYSQLTFFNFYKNFVQIELFVYLFLEHVYEKRESVSVAQAADIIIYLVCNISAIHMLKVDTRILNSNFKYQVLRRSM